MQIKQAINLLRAEFRAHETHTLALDQMYSDHSAALAKAAAAPVETRFLRALVNPISFPGFPGVLRGAVGKVPAGFEAGAQGHVDRGAAEWVTAEAERTQTAPGPASAVEPEAEETEEELQAELAALESPAAEMEPTAPLVEATHKRQADCVHCSKPYPDHAKNNQKPDDTLECKGLRRGFTPPVAVST